MFRWSAIISAQQKHGTHLAGSDSGGIGGTTYEEILTKSLETNTHKTLVHKDPYGGGKLIPPLLGILITGFFKPLLLGILNGSLYENH